jgi:uncharacterized protein YbbC (DUF1343 family)
MCHRMTMGEIAVWLKENHEKKCELTVIRMENWKRSMFYDETGLPWVIPSPNLPDLKSAIVYPGMVLFEALNVSEGRGTTIPFELFGAPFIDTFKLLKNLGSRKIKGCRFRVHNFIPTFNKFKGQLCGGMQIHVTDRNVFRPVNVSLELIEAIIETSPSGSLKFTPPPYEYEYNLMPFDILAGDDQMRKVLESGGSIEIEKERWNTEIEEFRKEFREIALYGE